jgi:alpha-glucosidase
MTTPADTWWRGAVLYQIYPRSFMDASGDGVGDLAGVTAKLDYVKSLGVDGIWLSPFFKSPMRDFGYDVADYRAIDPMFGTLEDFDALLAAAHARNLKVIIDQVWSHSSSDHAWFQQSRMDRTNDKADWYVWADPTPAGAPPNNWQAWFGGPTWTWEPRRRQYYLHNFLSTQPDLNLRNPAVQDAVLDIARFWLDRGVDGFRLDVVNYYIQDAQLRDNPPSGDPAPALPRNMQLHVYNSNQPETLDFLVRLREVMDSYGARMTVGEIAPGSFELKSLYTRGVKHLHTAYAFDFLAAWGGVEHIAETLARWQEGQGEGWPSWALSNHDVPRVATRWGEAIGAAPEQAAPLFLALLLSLRGTIFIYEGEELGLPDADVPFERLQDPWGIAGWPATKGRDGCRTPMPWDATAKAGFTTGEPWLPIDPRHRDLAVSTQPATLDIARDLIAFRMASPALATGALKVVHASGGILVFEREAHSERLLCVFNCSDKHTSWETDPLTTGPRWLHGCGFSAGHLSLDPYGAAILQLT